MTLRPALRSDARLLFEWVNTPGSLVGKLETTAPIPWPDHASWFAERLAEDDCRIWIGEREGAAIGQVRVQRRGERLEVDIFVDERERGRGAGKQLLSHVAERSAEIWPTLPLVARVRHDNVASRKLFGAAGYVPGETHSDHVVLILAASGTGRVPRESRCRPI